MLNQNAVNPNRRWALIAFDLPRTRAHLRFGFTAFWLSTAVLHPIPTTIYLIYYFYYLSNFYVYFYPCVLSKVFQSFNPCATVLGIVDYIPVYSGSFVRIIVITDPLYRLFVRHLSSASDPNLNRYHFDELYKVNDTMKFKEKIRLYSCIYHLSFNIFKLWNTVHHSVDKNLLRAKTSRHRSNGAETLKSLRTRIKDLISRGRLKPKSTTAPYAIAQCG